MGPLASELGLQATGPSLLALAIRGTALIGLAFAIAFLLRRSAGAARHILWSVTIASLLVLPLLSGQLPVLPVPLPARLSVASQPGPAAAPPSWPVTTSAAVTSAGDPTPDASRQLDPMPAGAPKRVRGVSATLALVVVWLRGAGVMAAALVLGLARAWRTVNGATPVQDPEWRAEIDRVRQRLGIRRRVRLLSARDIGIPLTGGIIRPVVLLPEQAHTWDAVRRRLVLQHELVHVRRLDALR